jgi:hypothetical protein
MLTRRGFLRLLVGGVLVAAVARTGAISAAPTSELRARDITLGTAGAPVYHEGWILTADDKNKVREVASKSGFDFLPKIDLPGGDLRDVVVVDEEECAALCMNEPRCQSFTYALPTHPLHDKRNRCWLKHPKNLAQNADANYISGLRR